MESKINLNEFVEGYEKAKTKSSYLKKFVVNNYVPYGEKVFLSNKIVESTSYDERKNVRIDSPSRYLLFVYTLLKSYTNLDLDASKMTECFDLLNKNGIVDELIKEIPENEINEFNKVLSMVYEDFMTNHYEIHGFIENIIEKISNVIDGTSPQLLDELRGYLYANGEKRNE